MTASANPLVVGASGQFYIVKVTVANAATTQPIQVLAVNFPKGITADKDGDGELIAGTTSGALVGCSRSVPGCSVAAGVQPGEFSIKIPVTVDATAIGPQGGNNSINLSGGGDSKCTGNAGEACDAATPVTAVVDKSPLVRIVNSAVGGTGPSAFNFALTGLSASRDTIVVKDAANVEGSPDIRGTAGTAATITQVSPPGWPANPLRASCVDVASTNPAATFGRLDVNALTIPAANMRAGADIRCTFVNSRGFTVTGRVFEDNGAKNGIANDGIANGAELGRRGEQVQLTDCTTEIYATTLTDATGGYTLPVPASVKPGAPLCVVGHWGLSNVATGGSMGSTQLPLGTSAGGGYVYTRPTPGLLSISQIAFVWNGASINNLNFGVVRPNSFSPDGRKSGLAGSTVIYAHTFVAATSGGVEFDFPQYAAVKAVPAISGWARKVFNDPGCLGTLQPGATLRSGSERTPVTAGQAVCILVQEFIPAGALPTYTNRVRIGTWFYYEGPGGPVPGLEQVNFVVDLTTVSTNALDLKKEVRNVTQGGAFALNNQAKSGETLEYRITYVNNGPEPITGLALKDVTPVYTHFVGSSEVSTPSSLTKCMKNTPANPAPAAPVACASVQATGGVGALEWRFDGPLNPGGSGSVLFNVKVD